MRAARSVTLAPIGTPSRSLKFAIDFLARVTIGFCPVIACKSAVAKSMIFALSRPSPTPMLITILSRRGTDHTFAYPRSFMSAGTTVALKWSLSRAATWPVPLGRPFATAGCVSGAFSRRGCPLACAGLPLCCCGRAAGFVASAFAMALASVDRLAAATAGADLAAVVEDLDTRARGLVAARTHDQHVGERQRPFALDDAALPQLLGRALVFLDHVHVLDEHAASLGEHAQHLPALAPLAAGDDADRVAATNMHAAHQMTSGAREMILVNCRSRSSRATGPKIRVPTGFSSGLISTTAFRSKRM